MKIAILLPIVLLIGCATGKKDEDQDLPPINPPYTALEAKTRLFSNFVVNDTWVVSKWDDGSWEHQGEGLLWSGILLTAVSCADGLKVENNLIAMMEKYNGAVVRIEPLGEYAGGREVTFDGIVGLYRGIAYRISNCEDSADKWKRAWGLHLDFLSNNGGVFHQNVKASLPIGFEAIKDGISHVLGFRGSVSRESLVSLGVLTGGWAAGVVASKTAGFRIHLSLQCLLTMQDLGYDVPTGAFCSGSRGSGIPLVEHFCDRPGLKSYIENFEWNEWEFRHQRAKWETPDGKPTLSTPGLDYLVALKTMGTE